MSGFMGMLSNLAAWLVCALVGLPLLVVALECLCGLARPNRAAAARRDADHPALAVLVPAHDEALGIGATLDALRARLRPVDRLLVVADNCSDATADIAWRHGAEVVERHDPARRGKGYALAAGIAALEARPPEVVIVVDADCRPGPDALAALALQVRRTGRPAQALYRMHEPPHADPLTRLSAFAFMIRNVARPLGLARAGLPVPLTGSGMAFPWPVLAEAELADGSLVEDLALGVALCLAGHEPRLCPDARVDSELPAERGAALTQRTRWEHGHLSLALHRVPLLLGSALRQRRPRLLAVALDLMVPPLSLLMLLSGCALALTASIALAGGARLPALLIPAAAALLALALILAGRVHGGRLSRQDLLRLPAYLLWKLPVYLRFPWRPETRWLRTTRR